MIIFGESVFRCCRLSWRTRQLKKWQRYMTVPPKLASRCRSSLFWRWGNASQRCDLTLAHARSSNFSPALVAFRRWTLVVDETGGEAPAHTLASSKTARVRPSPKNPITTIAFSFTKLVHIQISNHRLHAQFRG